MISPLAILTIAAATLLVLCTSAHAEWVALARNELGTVYLDVSRIEAQGHIRRVVTLTDLGKPDAAGDRSYTGAFELDCAGRIARSVSERYYAGPMSSGAVTASVDSAADWLAIVPGTVLAEVQETVCPAP
jgi:hypothetical protein